MTPAAIPTRLRWTVDRLPLRPHHEVMEIGAGRGVAATLVVDRLAAGHYVGLDRSATAVAAAERRNADAVSRGQARFVRAGLAEAESLVGGPFDVVFAVNVNLFWTTPATAELGVVRQWLGPAGRLWLAYEAPGPTSDARVSELLERHLAAAGFAYEVVEEVCGGRRQLGIAAHPRPSAR